MTPPGSVSPEAPDLLSLGRVHIVGIGGAGMSGIARIMMARGVAVSGSDAKDSRRVAALRALGAQVHVGHDAANLGSGARAADTVVISTAIPPTNPEVVEAHRRGLPVLGRAPALAAVMAGFRGVAVAGTHGKTTTTSMLTVALQHCGVDPSFAIGSELNESGSNAHLGSGDLFVVEADESDGAFLHLAPVAAIVTNVEADHMDHWESLTAIEAAFLEFATGLVARQGFLVVCIDDDGGARLAVAARAAGVDVRTYGTSATADYRVEVLDEKEPGPVFDVVHHGVRLGAIALQVPGVHNALNATAALATATGLGFAASDVKAGLEAFSGTRRRFDYRGTADGVRVYDDYAHHPTEIVATLRAARSVVGDGRLVVAFQPHRYTRTALFVPDFAAALGLADDVVVLEVYAAGERPIPGASGQLIAAGVPLDPAHVVFEPSWSQVARTLADRARPGDLVMTLGAGDVGMLAPEVLDLLRRRETTEPAGALP